MDRLPPTARLIGIGWYVAICIIGGVFGGVLLDRLFDSAPILSLIGLALGLFLALYGGYRALIEAVRPSQRRKE
jgi:hypothetical protein